MEQQMSRTKGTPIARQSPALAAISPLKPALASIPGACQYLGDPSRSKFYADLLPQLDIIKFGTRTFVTVESLDRLIAANRQLAAKQAGELPTPETHGSIAVAPRQSDEMAPAGEAAA
jgi:hypothetical protein